jgi:pyruvate formate-lyase activating enzyme-like uncharacterized protein
VGTADDLVGRLRALGEAGLDELMILPAFAPRHAVMERVARDVVKAL